MTTTTSTRPRALLSAVSPYRWIRRSWRDASVRRKFLGVVFVSMLVCLPPILVTVVVQAQLDTVRAHARASEEALLDLDALSDTLIEADTAMRLYAVLSFDDPEFDLAYRNAVADVPDQLATFEEGLPDGLAEESAGVVASTEALVEQLAVVMDFVPSVPVDENPSDEDVINVREPTLLDALVTETNAAKTGYEQRERFESLATDQVRSRRADIDRTEDRLFWATLASVAVALLAVAGGAVIVTTGIVRRLEELSEDGRRFLRGEPLAPKEPSADEIGRLTDNIVFMSEVLDQRRAEAVAATRAKNEFLWRIGHELRTPLTAIIGFGQLLEEEHLEPENLDSAQRIVSAGHHVLALIDELTDIAKIESGHITVSTEPITVHEVASETVVLVRSMASARSLALSADCPRHIVVIADRQRLTQVLINLLSNAVKYNRPDGRVHLAAVRTGATVRINVTDTGPGISDVDLDLLFRPYQRLGAEDSGIEGSGIGLALTKNLVEAMGGTIGVDTEVGRGTTFWVDLPAATSPTDTTPTDTTPDTAPDTTPGTATTTASARSDR